MDGLIYYAVEVTSKSKKILCKSYSKHACYMAIRERKKNNSKSINTYWIFGYEKDDLVYCSEYI